MSPHFRLVIRAGLMLVAGLVLVPMGPTLALGGSAVLPNHPLLWLPFSTALISIGPALLICGAVNLGIGAWRIASGIRKRQAATRA